MTEPSNAQRWVLALGAILDAVNENDHVHLGGVARPRGAAFAAGVLSEWDIRTPEQATARLDKLLAQKAEDVIAWDLGRAVNVAGWSYAAYLLDADAAWAAMTKAAATVQAALSSWSEFGQSYLRGRAAWRGSRRESADDKEQRATVERLIAAQDGPWALPWKTSLGKTSPPTEAPRTSTVDAANLPKAVAGAKDGDRIVVRSGVCRGALSFDKSVEIVADEPGAVSIEGTKKPLVRVDDASVLLVGVALRGTVHVGDGFLRLERCTVTSKDIGVDLVDDDAYAHIEASRVVSCGSVGALADRGVLVARDTLFDKNASANLQLGARAVLVRVRANGSSGSGLQVHDGAHVSMDGCEIAGNARAGLVIRDQASVTLTASTLRDNDTAHVWLGSTGDITLDGVEIHGGGGHGMQVLHNTSSSFNRCTVNGTGGDAVLVHESARPRFRGCSFTKAAGAGVRVLTQADPLFARCEIAGNAEGVVIGPGAKGRFLRCRVRDEITRDSKSKAIFEEAVPPAKLAGELGRRLARIDELLDKVSPDALDAMRAGATDVALKRLSKALGGKPLPEPIATFFRWHDGQSTPVSLHAGDNRTPMSIAESLDAWRFLGDPDEEILQPWSKTWLPLFTNGAGDYLCVITSGKDAGALVEYWHTDKDRNQPHASLEAWADHVIAALDSR